MRLTHYLLGGLLPLELLLYSDDFLFFADTKAQVEAIGFAIFMMALIGIPFRWKEFKGGTEINWIGYWIDVRSFREKRAAWLVNWLRAQLKEGRVDMQNLEAVLGRLCFAVAPVEYLRPFLAPIYAWVAAIGHRGKMAHPWAVRFLFTLPGRSRATGGRTSRGPSASPSGRPYARTPRLRVR